MSQVMEHVRQLADVIGPRPATTDAEAKAADYIEDVFRARGLDVERQEFDCPRTRTWVHVTSYALIVAAAVLANWDKWAPAAVVLSSLAAIALWLELDGRAVVSRLMPKGPSQNIIARQVPRARRGERLRKVVIVAHYDSAKPSLITSPSIVKNYTAIVGSVRWLAAAVPLLLLVGALPFAAEWGWVWYVALAPAALLALMLAVELHSELFMHATDGANDNASGVAAMLAVMEATVPEVDVTAQRTQPIRRGRLVAEEADVVLEDAILDYQPSAAGTVREAPLFDGFGDVGWETGPLDSTRPPVAPTRPAPSTRPVTPAPSWSDADEDADVSWEETSQRGGRWADEEASEGQERLDLGDEAGSPPEAERPGRRRRQARDEGDPRGVRDWLGIGRGFEVRKAGREIGTWDALADDEDDFGFKAGTAGDAEVYEDEFAAEEAARIRRRVTENVDRALSEKEIWFVATGAKESGASGMRAFLDTYSDDLEDALIINIDTVGAGTTAFITDEGVTRRKQSDRRLASQARRTARENDLPIKGRPFRGVRTDAGLALVRGLKAMSIMAFDINNRLANWHWRTDTIEGVQEHTVEQATEFVTALLRDL